MILLRPIKWSPNESPSLLDRYPRSQIGLLDDLEEQPLLHAIYLCAAGRRATPQELQANREAQELFASLARAIARFPQGFELQWLSQEEADALPRRQETEPAAGAADDEDAWKEEPYTLDWIECSSDNGWLFLVADREGEDGRARLYLERLYTPDGEIFDAGPALTESICDRFPQLAEMLEALEGPILEELASYEPFNKTAWNGGFSYADPENLSFTWEDLGQRQGSFVTFEEYRFLVQITARGRGRPRFTLLQVRDPFDHLFGASNAMRSFFGEEENLSNFYKAYQKSGRT